MDDVFDLLEVLEARGACKWSEQLSPSINELLERGLLDCWEGFYKLNTQGKTTLQSIRSLKRLNFKVSV